VIDDVLLCARFNDPLNIQGRGFVRPRTDPSGASRPWRYVPGQGFVVMACPETGDVEIKLSIPRLANGHPCNYPLRPLDDVALGRTVSPVLNILFGHPPEQTRGSAERWAKSLLTGWGVRRIAFAIDVHVQTIPAVLDALIARSRRGNRPNRWNHPTTGLQWDGENVRLQLYDKRAEILGKIRQLKRQQADFAPPSAELRNCLADRAHSLVRFEVTLKNARAVRDLAALPAGRLPNLRWIGRDEVGAYVLGTEAAKLKLVELAALDDVEGTDAVALARELGAAAKRSPSGRRGRPLSGTTIAALGFLHILRGTMSDEDIQHTLGLSARAFDDRRRELERMNLPCLGSADPSGHTHLRRFARILVDRFVDIPESPGFPPTEPDDVVVMPWADTLPDLDARPKRSRSTEPEATKPEATEPSVEDFDEFLH
jgi:hypothetical protein